jgi:hypothetical protein
MFRHDLAHGRAVRAFRHSTLTLACVLGGASLTASCIDRPVSTMSPETTNLFVKEVPNDRVDKIDLVFMIDNSVSMADKQAMLAEAVPDMMRRLIEPLCTDGVRRERPLPGGDCAEGLEPEFSPVRDIHVAVISSSLGGFGSDACDVAADATADDRAHLIGVQREGLTTYQGLGFLAWDPGAKKTPPGSADIAEFTAQLGALVEATGETGCGYEASLESWYRFLVQPDPPAQLVVQDNRLVPEGLDEELLAQRRAFLRPDSLVAIVMLTDENDCSVAVGGPGQMVGDSLHRMPQATAACEIAGPNDRCCRPCTLDETVPPDGCVPLAEDPVCSVSRTHDALHDDRNVRCFDQKRRFGIDFLYPVQRYIDGLTQPLVPDRDGNYVPNPLFANPDPNAPPRPQGWVFLAGIVGLPWQDAARAGFLSEPGLEYMSANELADNGRWSVLLGDPAAGEAASDPLMLESIDMRDPAAVNPIIQAPIAHPGTGNLNPINGHDYVSSNRRDLQYACIYPLTDPIDCASGEKCDCENAEEKPLCRDPATGQYGTIQYFAKAYPGVRHLSVLHGVNDQAIVASICPKVLDPNDPSYGYAPAVQAIIDRLADTLNGTCLPRDLTVDPELGTVPCKVIEALPPQPGLTEAELCSTPGRGQLEAELREPAEKEVRETGRCDAELYPDCSELVMCKVLPVQTEGDAALAACQNESSPNANGFCYIDASQQIGNPELVAGCPETKKRLVRLVSSDPDNNPMPRKGATVLVACRGKALSDPGE